MYVKAPWHIQRRERCTCERFRAVQNHDVVAELCAHSGVAVSLPTAQSQALLRAGPVDHDQPLLRSSSRVGPHGVRRDIAHATEAFDAWQIAGNHVRAYGPGHNALNPIR